MKRRILTVLLAAAMLLTTAEAADTLFLNGCEYTVTYEAVETGDDEIDSEPDGTRLLSLNIYGGSGSGSFVTFSPAFSPTTYNYVARVDSMVSSVTLYSRGDGAVSISKGSGSYAPAALSSVQALSYGLNEFDVMVGSAHYYINIYRPADKTAIAPSCQNITVNGGKLRQIAAYNIGGNNFIKLRDLAYLLSGTAKQLSVEYIDASRQVTVTTGGSYTAVGGEMELPGQYAMAAATSQSVFLDGAEIHPMAYNIDDSNYFLLRDMCALLDCKITFSGDTAAIATTACYGG